MYAIDLCSGGMIFKQSFMKFGTGVEAILRFCLSNLNDSNVGISDERYL
jgi:hypothetical protein